MRVCVLEIERAREGGRERERQTRREPASLSPHEQPLPPNLRPDESGAEEGRAASVYKARGKERGERAEGVKLRCDFSERREVSEWQSWCKGKALVVVRR